MSIDGVTTAAADEPRSVDDTQDLAPVRAQSAGSATSDDAPTDPGPDTTPGPTPTADHATAEPAQITDAVWRYHLDVLIGEAAGAQSWQGTDPVLGRAVGIRLLPANDERAEDLREAACLAARVSDRRLIHVLDVVDVKYEGQPHVAVVTEWISGRPLTDLLREPLPSGEALRVCTEVAECLQSAHSEGIAHGRIRPSSVLISDNGEVRLRGLGVEAVLRGCDPDPDPAISDINGVGALLYASTTGRWPYGAIDGLAGAPQIGGGTPLPSRVAPAVSATVDTLCARTVAGCAAAKDTPFQRMSTLVPALRSATNAARETPPAPTRARSTGRGARRLVAAALGTVAVIGLGLLGWQLLTGGPSAVSPRAAATTAPAPRPSSSVTIAKVERPLPYVRIGDYDPLGNGNENSEQAPLASDGSTTTAWTTVVYKDDYLSGKQGVGLLIDLGASRPVSAVRLSLVGSGTDLEIRTSDRVTDDPTTFTRFGGATGAPDEITVRSPKPVSTRYVLVWLTRVPSLADSGYQGGIREVAVLG